MRRFAIGILCLGIAGGCAGRGAPTYSFTELAVPQAEATVASGINAAGHIVGWYVKDGRTSGYLYKDGAFTTIAHPDAALTMLNGISDAGEIVGTYRTPEEAERDGAQSLAYHGFLRTASGEMLEIRHPDHLYTVAMRILPDGRIVGCYHDRDFTKTMFGIRVARSALGGDTIPANAFEAVNRDSSMHNGATPDGRKIVGILMDTDEAYTVEDGVVTTFMAPEAKKTEAWDINPSGVIVGAFVDAASVSHGFALEDGRYTTLDFPGAKETVAFGINANGNIVGAFRGAGGGRRGFIARRD